MNRVVMAVDLIPETAKKIALELVSALKEFHGYDVVHRDLKPQNVLRFGNVWKVADFGIAKNVSRLMTQRTFKQHRDSRLHCPRAISRGRCPSDRRCLFLRETVGLPSDR